MSLRCKVGDLAVIVRSTAGNEGAFVRVIGKARPGPGRLGHAEDGPLWWVHSAAPLSGSLGCFAHAFNFPDAWLHPIRPGADPESITADEVLEVGA